MDQILVKILQFREDLLYGNGCAVMSPILFGFFCLRGPTKIMFVYITIVYNVLTHKHRQKDNTNFTVIVDVREGVSFFFSYFFLSPQN